MKVVENIKGLMGKKEHFLLISFTVATAIIMLLIQYYTDGLTREFWLSLVPNVLVDMLGILITSYIIASLLQKSEEKKAKERVYKMLGARFELMMNRISKNYINLVTKKPCTTVSPNDKQYLYDLILQIKELTEDNTEYIQKDFLKKEVEYLGNELSGVPLGFANVNHSHGQAQSIALSTLSQEKFASHQVFLNFFKKDTKEKIDSFVSKYVSVLPEELREKIFNLENSLLDNVFITPLEFGVQLDISNAKFNVEDFQRAFKELGTDIYQLMIYFEGEKNKRIL
ncbi:hypothetical protein KM918_25050 [Priestia megaterium]|uniref:hypothetical protein n=1 Tax=Priestia megaterium TaxID=1404 RepID=UPI001C21059F|nr:hypothetical protein [Priestia megaterium]MBU8690568.1 hypothetical protein [Priestia megaterium]